MIFWRVPLSIKFSYEKELESFIPFSPKNERSKFSVYASGAFEKIWNSIILSA